MRVQAEFYMNRDKGLRVKISNRVDFEFFIPTEGRRDEVLNYVCITEEHQLRMLHAMLTALLAERDEESRKDGEEA